MKNKENKNNARISRKEYTHESIKRTFDTFKELKDNKEYGSLFIFAIESSFKFLVGSFKTIFTILQLIIVVAVIVFGIKAYHFAKDVKAFDGISESVSELTDVVNDEENLTTAEKYNHCVELIKNDPRFEGITDEELDDYAKQLMKIRYDQ